MNSSIRYEYGTGVIVQKRRFGVINWLLLLGALFGISMAAPRTLQKFGIYGQPVTVQRAADEVEQVNLALPVEVEATAVYDTAVVETGLQVLIEDWAKRNNGAEWSVAVQRLGNKPATASYNADKQMDPASLYKLYLLKSLNEKIPYSQWTKKYVAGRTVKDCVNAMITVSDNACAVAIGKLIGWSKVDTSLKTAGLGGSKMNSGSGPYATAADTVKLLALLNDGKWLESGAQDFVMNSMKTQKFRNGIPAGIVACDVYNKTGDLNGYKHDAAIIKCGELVYSMVVMSKGGSDKQVADLSRAVNNYLFSRR